MHSKSFSFADQTGDAEITVHNIYPGLQLTYHSVHMERLHLDTAFKGKLIEIHHCREGRIEQEFEDAYFYLTPGDLSIAIKSRMADAYHFPLRHYHGISIGIDMEEVPDVFRSMLCEIGVHPMEIAERLCDDRPSFILRAEKQIDHVFSELYSIRPDRHQGYFKLKLMELLLVLGGMRERKNQLPARTMPEKHVRLAKQIAAYLDENLDRHITISQLSQKFGLSDTHLKAVFKGTFGVPVFSYARIQKMQLAGQRLIHTDQSIADIAEEFGYINTSKFSAAFQDVMGETPSEFRRAHRK